MLPRAVFIRDDATPFRDNPTLTHTASQRVVQSKRERLSDCGVQRNDFERIFE